MLRLRQSKAVAIHRETEVTYDVVELAEAVLLVKQF